MSITLGFLRDDADEQLKAARNLVEVIGQLQAIAQETPAVRDRLAVAAEKLAANADCLVSNASKVGAAVGTLARGE